MFRILTPSFILEILDLLYSINYLILSTRPTCKILSWVCLDVNWRTNRIYPRYFYVTFFAHVLLRFPIVYFQIYNCIHFSQFYFCRVVYIATYSRIASTWNSNILLLSLIERNLLCIRYFNLLKYRSSFTQSIFWTKVAFQNHSCSTRKLFWWCNYEKCDSKEKKKMLTITK